jgi:hypothetical protein
MAKATKCEYNDRVIDVAEAKRIKEEASRRRLPYPTFLCLECRKLVQPHNEGSTGQGAHFEHRRGTVSPGCSRRSSK